jgi:uncharacterized membrane protein
MAATNSFMSKGRVEAFSDGVFAIAITLLILEIRLPGHEDGRALTDAEVWHELAVIWPSYLAYAVTFMLIGMVWMNHHRMFHHIARIDAMVLALNLLLLLDVAFLPFPTSLLADTLSRGEGEHAAAIFYGIVLVIGGIGFNLVWWYASSGHRLLGDHITPGEARVIRWRWGMGPALYLVGTLLGLFSAVASLALYVGLLVFYFFDMRPRPAVSPA